MILHSFVITGDGTTGNAGGRRSVQLHRARHRDRGQATVELAFVLSIVVLLLVVLVQIGAVTFDQVASAQHARHLARVAAVRSVSTGDDGAVGGGRTGISTRLDTRRLAVERVIDDRVVRVTVRYTSEIKMPWSGAVLVRAPVTAHAVMLRERSE